MIQKHTIHEHDVFAHISCVCMRLGNIAHTHTQYIGHTQANDTKTHHTCTQCICLYIVCLYAIGNIARIDTQYIGSLHVATTCRENRVLLHTHRHIANLYYCTHRHTIHGVNFHQKADTLCTCVTWFMRMVCLTYRNTIYRQTTHREPTRAHEMSCDMSVCNKTP